MVYSFRTSRRMSMITIRIATHRARYAAEAAVGSQVDALHMDVISHGIAVSVCAIRNTDIKICLRRRRPVFVKIQVRATPRTCLLFRSYSCICAWRGCCLAALSTAKDVICAHNRRISNRATGRNVRHQEEEARQWLQRVSHFIYFQNKN